MTARIRKTTLELKIRWMSSRGSLQENTKVRAVAEGDLEGPTREAAWCEVAKARTEGEARRREPM